MVNQKSTSLVLRDVIFPLWVILFFPPFLLVALIGNWLIDALIIWLHWRKLSLGWDKMLKFIFASWGLGFVCDLLGGALLMGFVFNLPVQIGTQFDIYNPFTNPISFLIPMTAVVLVGIGIWLCNTWLGKRFSLPPQTARNLAWRMAVYTAPWVLLVPTPMNWFH